MLWALTWSTTQVSMRLHNREEVIVIIQGEEKVTDQVMMSSCEVLGVYTILKVGPTRLANELVEDVRIRGQEKLRGSWFFLVSIGSICGHLQWMKIKMFVGLLNLSYRLDIQVEMLGRQLRYTDVIVEVHNRKVSVAECQESHLGNVPFYNLLYGYDCCTLF